MQLYLYQVHGRTTRYKTGFITFYGVSTSELNLDSCHFTQFSVNVYTSDSGHILLFTILEVAQNGDTVRLSEETIRIWTSCTV